MIMEWVQMDSDRNPEGFHRYIQEITPNFFNIIEHDTDWYNGPQMYYGYSTFTDLDDYSEDEILEVLRSCGFIERQNPQTEAACIAYQNPELEVFADNFEKIIQWKRIKGII